MPKKFITRPVTLRSASDRLGLALEQYQKSIFVARVAADSAGRRAGFVVGHIVTHVDDRKVTSPEQLGTWLTSRARGRSVSARSSSSSSSSSTSSAAAAASSSSSSSAAAAATAFSSSSSSSSSSAAAAAAAAAAVPFSPCARQLCWPPLLCAPLVSPVSPCFARLPSVCLSRLGAPLGAFGFRVCQTFERPNQARFIVRALRTAPNHRLTVTLSPPPCPHPPLTPPAPTVLLTQSNT
jgi:hypothetical protein